MRPSGKLILSVVAVSVVVAALYGWASVGAPGAPRWMQDRLPFHAASAHSHCCDDSVYDIPADTDVVMYNVNNHPETLRVPAGETVVWANLDEFAHTVTSDEGLFDSGLLDGGQTWSFAFTQPGTYRYHCTPHASPGEGGAWVGQTGTIIVE